MSEDEALKVLNDMDYGQQLNNAEMYNKLSEIEAQFQGNSSYLIEYRLGSAWRSFTSLFVRGDERKVYLLRSLEHFEQAFRLSEGKIPINISRKNESSRNRLDRITIAEFIGRLLVDEATIRDLEKGLYYLYFVFKNTTGYEPVLCSYAEGFYMLKNYDKAAEVCRDLLDRIGKDKEWSSIVPPAVPRIIAKAYRSKAKEDKKKGNIEQAINSLRNIIDMGIATENDQKMLERLQR